MIKIFNLGMSNLVKVDRNDPKWLEMLFGNFPSSIDLTDKTFPSMPEWPENAESKKFKIIWFPNEMFKNFDEADARLTAEGFGLKCRTFPFDLATEIVPRVDQLWQCAKVGKGPCHIYVSSTNALHHGPATRFLTCIDLHPNNRLIGARPIDDEFGKYPMWGTDSYDEGFLVKE